MRGIRARVAMQWNMTILDALNDAVRRFIAAGISTHRLDAEVIVCHAASVERHRLISDRDMDLPPSVCNDIERLVKRRIEGEPVAYLTGEKEFYSLPFFVNRNVLIPRPETELIVDLAIYHSPQHGVILDLCTGSGAIAIAVAHSRRDLTVFASDISAEALEVAEENALRILGEGRIAFRRGDLFEPFQGMRFDVIVSNPPYVDPVMRCRLAKELDFEPEIALYSPSGGLAHTLRIVEQARGHLNEGGIIILETGEGIAHDVAGAAGSAGFAATVTRDYSKLPRAVTMKRIG